MALLRKVLFWAHLATGLSIALLVLVMAFTGILLAYQQQISTWIETKDLVITKDLETARLSPQAVLDGLAKQGEPTPREIIWYKDSTKPVKLSYGSAGDAYLDAFTGEVVGRHSERTRSFFESTEEWHRWLALADDQRRLGRSITGLANFGFFFMLLSGFYLWWPRNWSRKSFRNILWFRRRLSPKAREFNWHNVIGFWSVFPLIIIVGTAVLFSYKVVDQFVFKTYERVAPVQPTKKWAMQTPILHAGNRPFDNFSVLEKKIDLYRSDWQRFKLEAPGPNFSNLRLKVFAGDEHEYFKSADLEIENLSGAVSKWETFNDLPPARSWRTMIRFAHTGELFGFIGQTIAALVSLSAIFLVWTGINLSWKRFKSRRKRLSK